MLLVIHANGSIGQISYKTVAELQSMYPGARITRFNFNAFRHEELVEGQWQTVIVERPTQGGSNGRDQRAS